MINKRYRRKMKKMIDHDTLKEMINDENQFENMKEYIKNHHSPDEFKQVMDIIREYETVFKNYESALQDWPTSKYPCST